ncbi:MAG: hypothetical protein RL268_833 [Pseudomonadota bacterium]|jgi:uncharacterized repeat protein (TIGR01451 family)
MKRVAKKIRNCPRSTVPAFAGARSHRGRLILPLALGLWVHAPAALAAGVSAGTLIESTATATYTSGTYDGSVTSNTVTVRVDEVVDVTVTAQPTTAVVAGDPVALSFSITNTGNGPEAFNLLVDAALAGNNFDALVDGLFVDSNGNGIFDSGTDQEIAAGAATPAISADNSLTVFAVVRLPAGATDGQTSQVRLAASAVTGTGSPGTSVAGQGVGGGDAVIGASGGDGSASASLVANLASVTLTKSAAIADPFGGSQPVPGATVTYTLTAVVAGSGQVENLLVENPIPAGTTYQPGTLKLDGANLTDAADTDAGSAGASGIAVTIPAVSGGTTKVVTFGVTIN